MKKRAKALVELILQFRRPLSLVTQLGLVMLSNRLAFALRFDDGVPQWAIGAFAQALPWLVVIRGLTFLPFRLYEGLWRYTSLYDLQALVGGVVTSSLLFYLFVKSPLGPDHYPQSVFILDGMVLTVLLGGLRLSRRVWAEFSRVEAGRRVLVFGAGSAGELIVRDMKSHPWYGLQPVGFVDDDKAKVGLRIHGVPVLGTRNDLDQILQRTPADEVLIAIPHADVATIRSIVRSLEPNNLPIKTLPHLRDIIDGKVGVGQIRTLAVEDLLSRAPVGLSPRPLRQLIGGKCVMVTGAGGSIGSELCRQIAQLKPSSLVMFERYENSLHAIRLELEDAHKALTLHAVVGDVTDEKRVNEVLDNYRPEIIFHAAAHKHVPLMEENPCEAVKNNVRGTRILARAADAAGVDRFIFISTDKAVNPTSVMGASKRVAELVVHTVAQGSGTSFSVVRFGNVLGSNGSVVPRFMDQIRRGGPVTVTDPEIKRFFMLIPEAVQLVLHAAAQEGGATYVLEMGEQVKLVDMARDLIRLSGLVPDEDIKIHFIGLRAGEKLYEELVGSDEQATQSTVEKILCVKSRRRLSPDLLIRVDALERHALESHMEETAAALRGLIGTFPAVPKTEPVVSVGTARPAPLAIPVTSDQPCPSCGTATVRRSRAKSVAERIRKELTIDRPYRCDACGWRGWLTPRNLSGTTALEPHPATDLESVDVVLGARTPTTKRAFSPRNLG